jgi:hypothetical protein
MTARPSPQKIRSLQNSDYPSGDYTFYRPLTSGRQNTLNSGSLRQEPQAPLPSLLVYTIQGILNMYLVSIYKFQMFFIEGLMNGLFLLENIWIYAINGLLLWQ